jgi:hypothetical protein
MMIWRVGLLCLAAIALLGDARAMVPPPAGQPGGSEPDAIDTAPRTEPRPNVPPANVPPANVPPVVSAPAGNPLWGIPLDRLSNTRERPIFSPTRRPPPRVVAGMPRVEPVMAPKPVEYERPSLHLIGTVIGEQESIGVFVDDQSKATMRLRMTEEYKGWVLRAVGKREVTLEKNGETTMLALPNPGTQRAVPIPPPPPPPPTAARDDTVENRRK